MMEQYILAHDLGTSGNKATLYDLNGTLMGSTVCAYSTLYPHDKWVEQNPGDWWKAVCDSTRLLLEETKIPNTAIACVSFSAQMMGCLLVDKEGNPLRNMIIWADTRSGAQEKRMIDAVSMERGYRITGHRLSASYSAAKLLWVKDNEPEVYQKAAKMIHAKDYITYRLTGKIVSDYSDASSTNLLDIEKKEWSQELIRAFEIREDLLPEIHPSTDIAGGITAEAARLTGLLEGTPVVIGGGDGSCACVGAGVVEEGKAYNVIGSSSWISLASKTPLFDPAMRTFNWVHLDPELYTPCGTMQAAGYSYSWYRDVFCGDEFSKAKEQGISPYRLIDNGAMLSPPGANGVLYLPYLLGERSPRWNIDARGAFLGMGISTSKADITRSVLEGVGYNLKVILDILQDRYSIDEITMIGGGAKGKVWLQILADIWQKTLVVPEYLEEATSMGAAVCGGVGIGAFKDFKVINRFIHVSEKINPNPQNAEIYKKMYAVFNQAYEGLLGTYRALGELSAH